MLVICLLKISLFLILLQDHVLLAAKTSNKNLKSRIRHHHGGQLKDRTRHQHITHVKEQHKYCSKPHKRLFNLRHILSDNTKGLLINHVNVSHLLQDDYTFHPLHILVKRCNRLCSYIGSEADDSVECKFTTKKIHKVFSATKNGHTEYHKLDVLEDRKCICKHVGFKSNSITSEYQQNSGTSKVK
ncbi:unnamed protein product, partial [Meganyctiphanes norvegica]